MSDLLNHTLQILYEPFSKIPNYNKHIEGFVIALVTSIHSNNFKINGIKLLKAYFKSGNTSLPLRKYDVNRNNLTDIGYKGLCFVTKILRSR